jgi:prepilin-type N-terminal cleavage/methylation domain-containing protein
MKRLELSLKTFVKRFYHNLYSIFNHLLSTSGFTLMELLVVVVLLLIIMLIIVISLKGQLRRGYDARRKADLKKIARAYEEYFTDTGCYPPAGILNKENCNGSNLAPYLPKIPCDPETGEPYMYITNLDRCTGFRILSQIGDTTDPDIKKVGCASWGCGFEPAYNWGVSAGVPVPKDGFDPGILPTGTPTPIIYAGNIVCTNGGDCNFSDNPRRCPKSFATDEECSAVCSVTYVGRCPD